MTREEVDQALLPELISVPTAAAVLTISRFQVYELIHAGRLEAVDVGSSNSRPYFRVRSESLKKLLGLEVT